MSLRINPQVANVGLLSQINRTQSSLEQSSQALSSGSRVSQFKNDTGAAALAGSLNSEVKALDVAQSNAATASSLAAVAEGTMSEQTNILVRMRELAIQSASDTYSDNERFFLQTEYAQLKEEVDRQAQSASFGSKKLLDGSSAAYDFQVGTQGDRNSRIEFKSEANTTVASLGISGSSVADKSEARDSLAQIDQAMHKLSLQRSQFGALQSRLDSAQNLSASASENLSAAQSKLADTDVAKEVSELRKLQVLQQYQVAVLQKNIEQASIGLRLIG